MDSGVGTAIFIETAKKEALCQSLGDFILNLVKQFVLPRMKKEEND
jgi:hypothetical protein